MSSISPLYLYHGSSALLEVLGPRVARGIGPEKDRLCAVYASHDRAFATIFALPICPNEDGNIAYWLSSYNEEPKIDIASGYLDLSQMGYLYRVPVDPFEAIDELQWVCYDPVVPFGCEVIDPRNYVHWIARGEVRPVPGRRGTRA